jgi:hypothetical protein
VRAQVVGIDITEEALARVQKAQFVVVRTRELVDLGVKITVLQTPEGMNASHGLKRLRKLDPEGTYDYNHVYLDSGTEVADAAPRAKTESKVLHPGPGRVGLIDGGLDPMHEGVRRCPHPSQRLRRQCRAEPARHGGRGSAGRS